MGWVKFMFTSVLDVIYNYNLLLAIQGAMNLYV